MAIIAKLLMLAALGFTGYAIYRMVEAFVNGRSKELIEDLDQEAEQLQELAMAKARTLRDIKDLKFDFETGHIADDEYQALRKRLERRGRAILKRLDELRGDIDYDELIDRELDVRIPGGTHVHGSDADLGPAVVAIGRPCGECGAGLAADARFCSECGASVPEPTGCGGCGAALQPDDRFCSECGKPAAAAAAAQPTADRPLAEVQA
jgi:predicted nucleic acid-binding Zn ribbon protein